MNVAAKAGRRGRPRNPDVDRQILDAAVEVLTERGLGGISVSEVAERAGVARATIYLRWPTREALLGAVARAEGGGFPFPMTGDLEADIRRGAGFAQEISSGAHFIPVLPELVAALVSDPQQLTFEDVAPNRRSFATTYPLTAADQGFDPSLDPNLPFDLLLGAQLVYMLANRRPATTRYVRDLADVIVAGLRGAPAARASAGAARRRAQTAPET
jgi:AcrR family transcriptional regulator